jgi:PAX-interacting protein 1
MITGLTDHCPYSQTNTPHYQKTAVKRKGKKPDAHLKHHPYLCCEYKTFNPSKSCNCNRNAFKLKILNGDQVKIQPSSTDKYHAIIKALAEKHTEFHTYQPKENGSFRTVLRGIHYSTDANEIKSEIEKLGHKVINIFNIKQTWTNILLPLLFIDLKPSDNNKEIYRIQILNYSKVKFKPPRTKRNIPQCSKCQRYGHTQVYCYCSPRCVKCTSNHPTKQCLRTEKSDAVKCVLCEGNYPANYKGCAIYKELQKRTFAPLCDK